MNKEMEDFLLNKKETLTTKLTTKMKKQFADVMAERFARKITKEGISITTAAVTGLTVATLTAALLISGLQGIAQQTFGDGPEHKPYEPLMADYLVKAQSLHELSLYKNNGKHIPTQQTVDAISGLSGVAQSNIQSASDAELGKLLEVSAKTFSNQAFADMRLSEKDLATLHSASDLKTTYIYSGAYMRNECAEKGLANVQSCREDPDMRALMGLETLLGLGVMVSFSFAAFGGYRVTYKGVEDKLDAKLPGHPDRPRQSKFNFG